MSVIGKKPFVNYIVDECSSEQVEHVISLLDNLGAPTHISFKTLNDSLKGVHYVVFNLDPVQGLNVEGILIYIDSTHCGLFSFTSVSGNMSEFSLDVANKSYVQIYEHLTVEELRQVCGDALGGGGGGSLDYATNGEIDALFGIQPAPTMWNVTYNLTGCWQGSGAESQIQDGGSLQFQLNPEYSNYEWQSVVITMGGVDVTSTVWNESNNEVWITNANGDIIVTAVCIEVQPTTATFIANSLINCSISGISSGDTINIGVPLNFTVTGTENNMVGASISNNGVAYTMEEIGSMVTDQGENWFQFTIPVVNGDIVVSFEFQGDEPVEEARIYFEDPATGEEITDLSMAQGETTNIYDYIQFENMEDTRVTLSCDDLNVINLTIAGVMEAVGSVGEGATITVTSVADSTITAELYIEIIDEEPEDIPVESIEFVNLPEDDSIELNVGDVKDMSQYIEVSPADATDKSYTLTTDAPSVLSINGTTITVLQGTEGLNANLTVTANDGSGCYDVMIVDILNGEEEPE